MTKSELVIGEDAKKFLLSISFFTVLPLVFVSAWAFTNESSLPAQVKNLGDLTEYEIALRGCSYIT